MADAHDWLRIESLDREAQGVAHDANGKIVFVDGALPGELVQVRILRRKNQWERGTLTALREESPQRVRPACEHFGLHAGACGGCRMQHLHIAAQVAIKQRVLEDSLWHLSKVKPECLLRPVEGPAWGYRCRARLSVRHVGKKGGVLVGFHERQSSYVADMRSCLVLPPAVSRLLLPLRELIGSMRARDRLPQLELAVGETQTVFVLRHLEPANRRDHWHVDALTRAVPVARVLIDIDGRECELVACDLDSGEWSVAVAGFGSSDCRRCRAHLLVFRGRQGFDETSARSQ